MLVRMATTLDSGLRRNDDGTNDDGTNDDGDA
jgi:hypothetical protein